MDWLLNYEIFLRLSCFIGLLILLVSLEWVLPRKPRERTRAGRWLSNSAIIIIDTLLLRILFPTAAIGAALWAENAGIGLLNYVALPTIVSVLIAIVVLDFAIWLQHLSFHHVPWLWRLHRMHHTDIDVDVTTAVRFHPLEMVLSMLIKLLVVVILGAPAAAVLIFEVLLNATSLFNHANIKLPRPVDAALRWLIVTPDMHRVHHSIKKIETNSNFGFNLTWWDRLFGTYRAQPQAGHEKMQLGIERFREASDNRIGQLLIQPFRHSANGQD